VNLIRNLARWLGLLLHLPMLLVFIVQGLNVPTEGVLFLVLLWGLLLVSIVILWRRAPLLIAGVPVLDVAIVYGVTAAGRALFDWRG
jgi:hypothetical protein